MRVHLMVLIVAPFIFTIGISESAQLLLPETECKTSKDCQKNEICEQGACRCNEGHVEYLDECFPVKRYGEECTNDIQCNDDRIICTNDDHDVRQKRFCFCDPYHLWNSTLNECLEISNITTMAGNFREAHNVSGMIERSAQKVFLGVVIAGLIFVSILLSFIGICSIYGCCQKHKKGSDITTKNLERLIYGKTHIFCQFVSLIIDNKWTKLLGYTEPIVLEQYCYGEDDLGKDQINEVAVMGLPDGTYEAIETDFSAMAI